MGEAQRRRISSEAAAAATAVGGIIMYNDGPLIIDTNYWQTEACADGIIYLSGFAGTFRLLLPDQYVADVPEMRTGSHVEVIRIRTRVDDSVVGWRFLFEDGSEAPYSIDVPKEQASGVMPRSVGRFPVAVWSRKGLELELPAFFSG